MNFQIDEYNISLMMYGDPFRVALQATLGDDPWGMVTVNLADQDCGKYQFFAKEYAENECWVPDVIDKMIAQGLIEETGVEAASGHVEGVRQFEFCAKEQRDAIDLLE